MGWQEGLVGRQGDSRTVIERVWVERWEAEVGAGGWEACLESFGCGRIWDGWWGGGDSGIRGRPLVLPLGRCLSQIRPLTQAPFGD